VSVDPRAFLRGLFDAAVAAALPAACVPAHLPAPRRGRTIVIGAGKAAAAMAQVVEERWRGPVSGVVVTRYGHGAPCRRIEVIEAGHPLPDDAGAEAARRILALAGEARADDLVLCLLSGGGSALLAAPAPGLMLEDEREVTRALLAGDATIAEINCVRKHLSAIKGGRLALACGDARVHTLAISDVPGDDPAIIASGPTLADATTSANARDVLGRYDVAVPARVEAHLRSAASETPKPGDPRLARSECVVVARAQDALDAAARVAEAGGVVPVTLGDRVEGEAREVARGHAQLVRELLERGAPVRSAAARRDGGAARLPCVLLSGGETTVTVRGRGRGGRNGEYLLALAAALDGLPGVHAIACDTDGIDGTADSAGAIMTSDTMSRARALRLDAGAALADNDSHGFFAALGDLVTTGPTRTNVNDFRAILVTATEGRALGAAPAAIRHPEA
jgi:hydroxypyruvate reductase